MPYIPQNRREELEEIVKQFFTVTECNAGDLNYLITQVLVAYMEINGKHYKTLNDLVGALECAKMELYRRIIVPYENTKMATHGDAY